VSKVGDDDTDAVVKAQGFQAVKNEGSRYIPIPCLTSRTALSRSSAHSTMQVSCVKTAHEESDRMDIRWIDGKEHDGMGL